MDPQAPEKVKFIQLTFNKMKGVRGMQELKKNL
jgi:hypothetical protein